MSETFNLYCDESCHLENDKQKYMIISYVSSPYNHVKMHTQGIITILNKYNFKNEIKWNSVSKSKYPLYVELIEYFFASDLVFRAVVVDKEKIDSKSFWGNFDDFYFKMYYQLLYHKINMGSNYNIYLDIKDTLSASKVRKLKEILNVNYTGVRNIQNIRSEESLILQMTDLLMGAISYHLRNLNGVIAKNKLIEKIQQLAKTPLVESTAKNANKFNLFFIELR